jgi:hypothetical protein
MKKQLITLCAALALILTGCKSGENDPEAKQKVVFKVATFEQTQEPMNAPGVRRSPILDDEGGSALTDIYAFDGTTLLAHQTNDQEDFGTIALELTHGNHDLSFVATRSSGLSYNAGVLSCTSLRSTFGKLLSLNVSSSTPTQNLALDRLNGQLYITINDAFPSNAAEIAFTLNPRYEQLNVATICGTNGSEKTVRTGCTSKVGKSGEQYNIAFLAPSLDEEFTSDVTITVYNAGGDAIYNVLIEDVRMAANTKTMLSGNLFTTPSASVTVNTSWNTNIVGTF